MKRAMHLAGALLLALRPGLGEAASIAELIAERQLYANKMHLARANKPQRRDAPLRTINITNAEVAQIEKQVKTVLPDAIVNIGAVVRACPCQNGPQCSDQVWVLAETDPAGQGLQLSRVDGQWTLGAVQHWWLRFEQLTQQLGRVQAPDRRQELREQRRAHVLNFPECTDGGPLR